MSWVSHCSTRTLHAAVRTASPVKREPVSLHVRTHVCTGAQRNGLEGNRDTGGPRDGGGRAEAVAQQAQHGPACQAEQDAEPLWTQTHGATKARQGGLRAAEPPGGRPTVLPSRRHLCRAAQGPQAAGLTRGAQ